MSSEVLFLKQVIIDKVIKVIIMFTLLQKKALHKINYEGL